MVICEWRAWDRFLARALFPRATRITVDVDEPARALLGRIERAIALQSGKRQGKSAALRQACVLFHFDLTEQWRLPVHRETILRHLARRGVVVWNSRIRDLSKRSVQACNRKLRFPITTAPPEGRPRERVILKSNWNAFGNPEYALTPEERTKLDVRLPRKRAFVDELARDEEYPVMTRAEAPSSLWRRRDLHIERYITNESGEFFRIYVAGEACILCHSHSTEIVKRPWNEHARANYFSSRTLARDPLACALLPGHAGRALANAVRFADAFALDYGAVDVVCDDHGTPHVVDANVTPWWGEGEQPGFLEHLRTGLKSLPREMREASRTARAHPKRPSRSRPR